MLMLKTNNILKGELENILHFAYPEKWDTAWLALPLESEGKRLPYNFHVICSDLPSNRNGKSWWPPTSSDHKVWFRWESTLGNGFWIRPRKFDPIIRDRMILIELNSDLNSPLGATINHQSLLDACYFAAISGRMVWHNPPKGGASSPEAAHFQSIPVYWQDVICQQYSFPCCISPIESTSMALSKNIQFHLLNKNNMNQFPVFGLVVTGSICSIADFVWDLIWNYDKAQACNLIIQPISIFKYSEIIRVFVFPRNRNILNHSVREQLLEEDEKILMQNNRGSVWSSWSFAGVEMGLLTQVECGKLFEEMRMKPKKWGKTLLRVLQELTLKESENDWIDFVNIVESIS